MKLTSKAKTAYGLLSEIRALILAEPLRYNQRSLLTVGETECALQYDNNVPSCHTVGCVAGWTAALKTTRPNRLRDPAAFAERTLGLTDFQADELFTETAAGRTIPQTQEHAEAGAAHIARFQQKYRTQLRAKKV